MPEGGIAFYDEAAVRAKLRYPELIEAVQQALIDLSAGWVAQPVRGVIRQEAGLLGSMPAVYGPVMGAKLVTFFHGNGAVGLPTHQAMIVLFDARNGAPLAVLDGRLITEMRTAAASAVAVRALAPRVCEAGCKLAILGSGVQARAHIEALGCVARLESVRVWSRTRASCEALAAEGVAKMCATAEEAVRGADVVVTVTASKTPVLAGRWLADGAMVCAVGNVGATTRELDDEAVRGSVVVESRAAAMVEAGEILIPGVPVYAELGEVLAGSVAAPTRGPVVFKSLGVAATDLAAARLVLAAHGHNGGA